MTFLILLIILAWGLEAFFSGTETAFISVNFLKLMHLIEKKNKRAMLVHDLLKKPVRLMTTTLVGTNFSVVISSACATALFSRLHSRYDALLATLVMTPVSFIFCQLLPKTVFRYHANRLILVLAAPLDFCEKLFFPFVNFFTFFANSVSKIVNPKGLKKNPFLTKDEIKSLIKEISREGILQTNEKEAIDMIFDLTLARAADVMVPLKDVVSVDYGDPVDRIKEICRQHRFTRIPIFENKVFKGIVNVFDIFYSGPELIRPRPEPLPPAGFSRDWRSLIRPVLHIGTDESLDKVFGKMQTSKEVMAAVFKGPEMVGILTMEDLMEDIASKLTAQKKI